MKRSRDEEAGHGETEAPAKRFVADSMLGKLAKWLRILGFDTRCELFRSHEQLEVYSSQGYLLLTRRENLSGKAHVFFLKANDPSEQLREVVARASITQPEVRLLQRCVFCNDRLIQTGREEVFGKVPDYVLHTHTIFRQCPACQRIYWPGSHPHRMMQRLERTLGWEFHELGEQSERRGGSNK